MTDVFCHLKPMPVLTLEALSFLTVLRHSKGREYGSLSPSKALTSRTVFLAEGRPVLLDSPSRQFDVGRPCSFISRSEVRQMGRKNPLESALTAIGLVILLCASTAIGIELSRFFGAIWR